MEPYYAVGYSSTHIILSSLVGYQEAQFLASQNLESYEAVGRVFLPCNDLTNE